MRCCVPFCKTTAEIVSESEDITFHAFPRDVDLCAAWLRALGKEEGLLPAGAVVCSQHFLEDEIQETESGSKQICAGAVPATVLICLICLDTRNKLLLMSKHKLEQAYQHLVGHPGCGGGRLKRALCVRCAQRLVDYSTFREESLRARCLLMEMLHAHEVITRRHVALLSRHERPPPSDATATVAAPTATNATDVAVAVKREVEHRTDGDTAACAYNADSTPRALREQDYCKALEDTPAEAETLAPMKRQHTCKPESSEDCNRASVAPVILATSPGNGEHPTDPSDDWDILLSFGNNTNVLEDPRKSLDTALIPKELLATTSDSIDYRTTRQDDRVKNEQSKYSQGIQYICDVCQKIFHRKASLVSHIRAHTLASTSSCKLRDRKLNQNHTLSSPKTTRTEESFACELCKYKCTRKSHLVMHMRTHTGEKPFACKLCKHKFTQKSYLVRHMRTHTGEKPFACNLCKHKFTQKSYLVRHMRTHTGEKPFACKLCKHKFTQKSYLVKHMKTHTGEKPFACKLCKYKCTEKSRLVRHMRTHTGEKPFACKLCKYKCTEKSRLVSHMRTHTGEKPFACELCKYKCTEKCNLMTHMRTHTGETPFACNLCKYKCTVKSHLLSHMLTHTGEKPFACKLCKHKCTQKGDLVRHMRTHTGETPFACKLCKYKCTVKSNLLSHMRTHSGEKPF